MVTSARDPEILAIEKILRVLTPFSPFARGRILRYVEGKTFADSASAVAEAAVPDPSQLAIPGT